MHQIYVAGHAKVKIRGYVAYHVVLTWVIRLIPIGYVARHAGITWEACRAGPEMPLQDCPTLPTAITTSGADCIV